MLVKIFVWVLEMPVVGWVLLHILKKDNLINKLVSEAEIPEPPLFTSTHRWEDTPEQNVSLTKPGLSPAERVREAVDCLPARLESTLAADAPPSSSLKRWTIMDFSRAYSSGETTPVQVAKRFLAAVKESSGPTMNMAFFISCNPEDVLKQAEESTLRYQTGTPLSVMDGVLVAVKDEIDCLPYPTTGDAVAGEGAAVRGGRGVRGAAARVRRRPRRQDQHARARRRHQRHQPAPRIGEEPVQRRQGGRGLLQRLRRRGLRWPLPRRARRRRRRLCPDAGSSVRRGRLQAHRRTPLQRRSSSTELDGRDGGDLGRDSGGRRRSLLGHC
ncbi:unnamed protein product [Triticum turgidum subsp. durum]|uniref:Amidase domain-containing protein n=1 Tax=Triticum turgidum subsp. durum TaxID=4567 RepID=A0A9R0R5K8_TRITD|nr:unnamed protein product [Triticum turgidum subsp. durum]